MVSQWTVLGRLRQYVTLDEQGADNALPLCKISLSEITERLRDGVDADDIRIAQAAAGLAFYKLTVRTCVSNEAQTSFKAGDVTVTHSPQALLDAAAQVRNDALRQVLPLLRDDEFLFRQVE